MFKTKLEEKIIHLMELCIHMIDSWKTQNADHVTVFVMCMAPGNQSINQSINFYLQRITPNSDTSDKLVACLNIQ